MQTYTICEFCAFVAAFLALNLAGCVTVATGRRVFADDDAV